MPRNRYNIMTLPKIQKLLNIQFSNLKSGQQLWVLNHEDQAPKFLKGILVKQILTNTFCWK